MRRTAFLLSLICAFAVNIAPSWAGPIQRRTHPDFTIPPKLRGRVDFWTDVFTTYGKSQMIIHHRDFPQIRFGVIDLTQEAVGLNDDDLNKLKKKRGDQEIKALYGIFGYLATGAAPRNDFEQRIVDQMAFIPGGSGKFKSAIKDDLIRTQSGIKERYAEAVRRAGRYLPLMQDVFRDYTLPTELTMMPFIESSFDYKAYSSVGAAGIWQFMRRTGLLYLRINAAVDERRDPVEATKAAARYLSEAYSKLGTWPLAITSYNHGIAGVARKVRESGTSNLADIIEDPTTRYFGFASTNFYPEFLAALEVYDNYQQFFPGLVLEQPLQLKEVRVTKPTQVQYLSRKLNVDLEALRAVNYAISEKAWSGRVPLPVGYSLKVPTDRTGQLNRAALQAEHEVPPSVEASSAVHGGIVYRVRKGDTLASIAQRHRVTVAALKQLNNLSSNKVSVGQSLKIEQEVETREPARPPAPPAPKKQSYRVQKGDSLWSIAKKFSKSPAQLKAANALKNANLREGDSLVIP